MPKDEDAKRDDLAAALSRIEHDHLSESEPSAPTSAHVPPDQAPQAPVPPASAAEFRRPARPDAPGGSAPRSAAPEAAPQPPAMPGSAPAAKSKPARPDRPDRPTGPPSTTWSDDEAAEVAQAAAQTDDNMIIVDDDSVIVPAPGPDVFAPHATAKPTIGVPNSLAFRRTAIPVLLTCGVLLIGIGLLRWIGGADSLFREISIPLSALLFGSGAFLLVVAVLNMLQVKAELSARARRAASQ